MSLKNVILVGICMLQFAACKQNTEKEEHMEAMAEYASFGKKITQDDVLSAMDASLQYEVMSVGDTIESKITAKISEVCQVKGCWMTLNLENGREVMVKFKDYSFFVPKNIVGKDVIINGLAYIDDMSVEAQHHYAKDAGKPASDLATIVQPKRTWSFEADGVLIAR